MKHKELTPLSNIQSMLMEVKHAGAFERILLTDNQGLPIVSSMDDMEQSEVYAAVVSMVQKMATQINQTLQTSNTAEFILDGIDGKRLVIRPFKVNDTELLLSVLITDHQSSYRRLLAKAIRSIKSTWMY